MNLNTIYCGNSKELIKTMPDNYVDCVVTSPPYYGLRNYGNSEQIGLEESPELFVRSLVDLFLEVFRVLKPEGTLWLNIGDSYNGYHGNAHKGGNLSAANQHSRQQKPSGYGLQDKSIKPKDLIGIPWMVAFALREIGFYLRQDIIWHKPNPMPESVTDRCTKSHEYIFLFSKSQKYYYDHKAIMTECIDPDADRKRYERQSWDNKNAPDTLRNGTRPRSSGNLQRKPSDERGCPDGTGKNQSGSVPWEGEKANKRSVWTVNTKPFPDAHFATFPQELIVDCIKAGCPENGIVFDPFMGAGTTAVVSRKLNRNYIGLELNPDYINIANKRLHQELGFLI